MENEVGTAIELSEKKGKYWSKYGLKTLFLLFNI